jgi:molybdopterin converting factor small subunit
MPRLRLFGPAATAAGTRSSQIAGTSVEEVLAAASAEYGRAFAEQLQVCRVWVNGEPPRAGARLGDTDEVAVLPPVSGG